MLTMCRPVPAKILSDEIRLDSEYKSAHWIHHRLLDFEDLHQHILDAAAEAAAPGIVRVGRILSRLARRVRRRERTTEGKWSPNPRPELAAQLKVKLSELREVRNKDERWAAALAWADEEVGEPKSVLRSILDDLHEKLQAEEKPRYRFAYKVGWTGEEAGKPKDVRRRRAKDPSKIKRGKKETDEKWAKRFALFTADETEEHYAKKVEKAPKQKRREAYRTKVYAARRIYWGTYNALCKSVDQARNAVLERRKQGLPAEWHRPKFPRDSASLVADKGFRIVSREGLWWTVEMRIGVGGSRGHEKEPEEWVKLHTKYGNWHEVPKENVKFTGAKLTRRQDGSRSSYSLSLTVEGVVKKHTDQASAGVVSFDWGHREHGHERAAEGIRAFVWRGSDGQTGEILVPAECRRALDEINELKSRMDKVFDTRRKAQGISERKRHKYRRKLERAGVRTEEESNWLRWEMRYERMIMARRKRIKNLRRETYLKGVRALRERYGTFAFEDLQIHDALTNKSTIRTLQTDGQNSRRSRENRDLTARYEFISLCERFGAAVIEVSARNTTRECPSCGHLSGATAEVLIVCAGCGEVRDRDHSAAIIILRRAEEVLAKQAQAAE